MTDNPENQSAMNADYRDDVSTLLRGQLAARSRDDTITIRPIEPADRDIEQEFVRGLSPWSRYQRFLTHIKELSPALLDRFTNVSFPDSMALVATIPADNGERQIGVARYAREGSTKTADFAVVVADEWRGEGVGSELSRRTLAIAKAACIDKAESLVLRNNTEMLRLAQRLGFALHEHAEDPVLIRISKQFRA